MVKRFSDLYHSTEPQQRLGTLPTRSDSCQSASIFSITSQALFAGADELEISHQGSRYRLRQTALGKLILTK
jgi:hemin uptake protein HemP